MKWKQDKPRAPGYYLRFGRAGFIQHQIVESVGGKLMTVNGIEGLVPVHHLPNGPWYYGPIPEPPKDDQ